MSSTCSLLLFVLATLLSSQNAHGALDATFRENSGGCEVIEAVLTKITLANAFSDDYGFLRRIAYAETRAGQDTSAKGRGPWAVTQAMFTATQATMSTQGGEGSQDYQYLRTVRAAIQNSTQLRSATGQPIEWNTVTFSQLNQPFYSALASRLYLHLQLARSSTSVPVRVDKQAEFWSKNFLAVTGTTPSAMEETRLQNVFINRTRELDDQCACNADVDMALVMDMSGSVGSSNFVLAKQFAANIASSFDVGTDATRIALITYSSSPTLNFGFTRYTTTSTAAAAINAAPYRGGGTATGRAIRMMITDVFRLPYSTATTAPPFTFPSWFTFSPFTFAPVPTTVPVTTQPAPPSNRLQARVGIVLTDGKSGDDVKAPADRAHELGITLFSIGVGNTDANELNEIASDPDQAHVFYVGDFTVIENVRTAIRQRSCRASAPLELGTVVQGTLRQNETQFVSIDYEPNQPTITVEVSAAAGNIDFYASFQFPNPSAALNDFASRVIEGRSEAFILNNPSVVVSVPTTPPAPAGDAPPKRERRQASGGTTGSNTLYVSVVGRSATNQFTLQAQTNSGSGTTHLQASAGVILLSLLLASIKMLL